MIALTLFAAVSMMAQKSVYIPYEWLHPWNPDSLLYADSDPDNNYTWSRSRSVESDNIIVFWDKGYGSTPPSKAAYAYRVDEQELLKKCEAFYDLEINRLGFVDPVGSNVEKYKVMVLLNHTTDWVCYGSGYDFMVPALWLGPSACKPVGHSVAHEVGHAFHYMCYAEHSGHKDSSTDNTGFHLACGNGQTIWEQTAQWQAAQSYPDLKFDQSIGVFRKSHNYAFSHEWHRYQSYWFHYYINDHYNDVTTVAQVWRQPMIGQANGNATDFNQALMKLKGLDVNALYRLYYDYAARLVTWDINDVLQGLPLYSSSTLDHVGDFEYCCVSVGANAWQVALASTPQSTGFNVVPLQVPEAGTAIVTHFTALPAGAKLANGDPAEMMNGETVWGKTKRTTYIRSTNYSKRGFRLGYVTLMADGTRRYFNADSVYCTTNDEVTCDVGMTVPPGTAQLWLVVSPAPTSYVQHKWTDSASNSEHWPYRFSLEGTTLGSKAIVYEAPVFDGREVSDITFTYNVNLPKLNSYDAVTVNVSGKAAAMLATALQTNISDVAAMMQTYSVTGPAEGKMMFYPLNPATFELVQSRSTANGYGHWFDHNGNVCAYSNGYIYSEMDASTPAFNIGQYPNKVNVGETFTIAQALRYKQAGGKEAIARFIFHVTITNIGYGSELLSIDYKESENPSSVGYMPYNNSHPQAKHSYHLSGRKASVNGRHAINIVDGRKVINSTN
jgi:hypothetical protein